MKRLDRDLAAFVNHVTGTVGATRVTFALTSDHGVQAIPGVARARAEREGRTVDVGEVTSSRLEALATAAARAAVRPPPRGEGVRRIAYFEEPGLWLDWNALSEAASGSGSVDPERVRSAVRDALAPGKVDGVSGAWTNVDLLAPCGKGTDESAAERFRVCEAVRESFRADRSPDVVVTLRPGWIWKSGSATTHGQPVPDDMDVPLVFWGAGVAKGLRSSAEASPLDIAPTLGALLGVEAGRPGARPLPIISIRERDGRAALTNVRAASCGTDAGAVDLLDLSDPERPSLLRRVCIDPARTAAGAPNSVAVHPSLDYFLVVVGRSGAPGAVAAYRLSDGSFLASVAVGIQPDSIAISPDGRWAVVANEAEGVARGDAGGPGSLSVIDLARFRPRSRPSLEVKAIELPSLAGFPGFCAGRTDDVARLPIDNTPATLEPESVAFSADSRYAYVTLQENDGVARLELRTGKLAFFGLGETTHLADLVADGIYAPSTMLTAFREPDGIALDPDGKFFVTADEGDSRNGAGNSAPRGGRTVSVFDARTGAFLGDITTSTTRTR